MLDDSFSGPVSQDNIVRELIAAGKSWKSYAEGLPSVGYTGPDVAEYVRRHNPFAYFFDVQNDSAQSANLIPFSQFSADLANDHVPDYAFVVPDLQNDAHDCPAGQANCTDGQKLAAADNWLKKNIGPVLNSPAFTQAGLLIILFDESSGNDIANGGGHVPMLILSPKAKAGFQSSTLYQHQSTLRLTLEALGMQNLPGLAAIAPEMGEFSNKIYTATVTEVSVRVTGRYSVSLSIGSRPASRIRRMRSSRRMPCGVVAPAS